MLLRTVASQWAHFILPTWITTNHTDWEAGGGPNGEGTLGA